jgi:hypothetical protein
MIGQGDRMEMSDAEQRLWARLPAGTADAIAGLSGSELQTLLMPLMRERAARVRPADLLRRWREDRFVRPATADPRQVARAEARLWSLLPDDVHAVQLSPVVPLGTCTAVTPTSQNRIVTTTRPVEVLSDPTNALAIEAAARRADHDEVHVAAAHQVLRAQHFGPGRSAHFRLFSLVSTARDTGSGRTEARLLQRHAAYWQQVLAPIPGAQIRYTIFDSPGTRPRLLHRRRPAHRRRRRRTGRRRTGRRRTGRRRLHHLDGPAALGRQGTLPDLLHLGRTPGVPDRTPVSRRTPSSFPARPAAPNAVPAPKIRSAGPARGMS